MKLIISDTMTSMCNSSWNSHWAKLRPLLKDVTFSRLHVKHHSPQRVYRTLWTAFKRCVYSKKKTNQGHITCSQKGMFFFQLNCCLFYLRFEEEGRSCPTKPTAQFLEQTKQICFPSKKMPLKNFFLGQKAITLKSSRHPMGCPM